MMAGHLKMRKKEASRASIAGGATCHAPASREGRSVADDNPHAGGAATPNGGEPRPSAGQYRT